VGRNDFGFILVEKRLADTPLEECLGHFWGVSRFSHTLIHFHNSGNDSRNDSRNDTVKLTLTDPKVVRNDPGFI
jgi:hypothetical protein